MICIRLYGDSRSDKLNKIKNVMAEILCFCLIFIAFLYQKPLCSLAHAPTAADVYSDMVEGGLNVSGYLAEEDAQAAYSNIRPTVVAIHAAGMFGSGSIWEMSEDRIIIITNYHVISEWINLGADDNSEVANVIVYTGRVTMAELLGYDSEMDVAFLSVDISQIPANELIKLRAVRRDENAFDELKKGDGIIAVKSVHNIVMSAYSDKYNLDGMDTDVATEGYLGTIMNTDIYVTDMNMNMLYANCYAESGMSGGGAFDTKGNYIGMLTGGSDNNESVCVRLPDIEKIYDDIEP